MQQCRFCGTFNDPSLSHCTTCDTSLDPQVQARTPYGGQDLTNPQLQVGGGQGQDHTLNTRPLTPGAQLHQANQRAAQAQQAQQAPYGYGGEGQTTGSGYPDETAQFHINGGDAQAQAAYNQRSPHNSTDNYNVPPYLSTPSPPQYYPQAPAAGAYQEQNPQAAVVVASAPAARPAPNAFDSAGTAAPAADNPYQVDFGGFHSSSATGMSGKLRSLMVFLGLCCMGILAFCVYLFFADPSDEDKNMAAKRKGPDLTNPLGKTKHLLDIAKVHIAQQRWSDAKSTIHDASSLAPNQDLKEQASALHTTLLKEKHASDWFQQALKYDKKGEFGSAYASLQKVDSSTKPFSQAQLLLKRIREQRLPQAAQLASRLAQNKRTYSKAYLTLLRIEQVAPTYKGLRRAMRKTKSKLQRELRKGKGKCRKRCRRRYRTRRRRKSRTACYERCGSKYVLPVVAPISIKPPKPTLIASRNDPPPAACCAAETTSYETCATSCLKKRKSWCYSRARRKYRRSKRRRNKYIRRFCTKAKLLRYCKSSKSRRACRRSFRKLRSCKRRCR